MDGSGVAGGELPVRLIDRLMGGDEEDHLLYEGAGEGKREATLLAGLLPMAH